MYDTCLNDGEQCHSGAISDRCKTGVPDSHSTPTKTNAVACNLLQLRYHLLKQLSSISTTLPCSPPPPTTIKISCKEQIKIKFDIDLWQNCDQSVTIWWSKRSSARHWTVGEWRLTSNKSAGSNTEPTYVIREILLKWLERKPPFL